MCVVWHHLKKNYLLDNALHYAISKGLLYFRSTSCPSEALGSQNVSHKKTGSLDGSNGEVPKSSSRPKQPAPLVRERY